MLGAWLLLAVLGSGIIFLRSRNRGGFVIGSYVRFDEDIP